MRDYPPAWAETLLRLFLPLDSFASVSGDLLEQYRDSVLPSRGRLGADRWYATQACAVAVRKSSPWAAIFGFAVVARSAWDWLQPPGDFRFRSEISTAVAAAVLLAAGSWTAWRAGSLASGIVSGIATTILAALVSIAGQAALFAIWHDPVTLQAIRDSGGLGEAFLLPVFLILPGAVLGGMGGMLGAGTRRLLL